MVGAEDRVREIVWEDPFLCEALARGILNKAGAARWIRTNRDVDAEEETIRSAIADLESEDDIQAVADVHPLLATAKLKLRPDIGSIRLRRREGIKEPLAHFVGALSLREGETFHSTVSKEEILLILQADRLAEAQDIFDSPLVADVDEEVTKMTFYVEDDPSFGLLGIVLKILVTRGIDVLSVDGNPSEATVFIPTSEERRALRLVDSFGVRVTG